MRIQREVLKDKRAEYGEQVVKNLAEGLTKRYGRGFRIANLYHCIAFYNYHPDIFYAVSRKSEGDGLERMYDELMCPQGHNPTIGLILCADTDDDVAHYSVLNGSDQLFAAKYLTYMPSREVLRREIEQQKEFFLLQHKRD